MIMEVKGIDPTIVHDSMVIQGLINNSCKQHPRMEAHILTLKWGEHSLQEIHQIIVRCCSDLNLGSKPTVPAPEENADEHVAKPTAMQAFATAVGGLSPSKVAAYFMGYGAGGGQKFHNAGNKGQPNPGNKGQPNQQETGSSTSQRQQGFANGKWDPKSKNRIRNRKYPTAAEVEASQLPSDRQGLEIKALSLQRQLAAVTRDRDQLRSTNPSAHLAVGFNFDDELNHGFPTKCHLTEADAYDGGDLSKTDGTVAKATASPTEVEQRRDEIEVEDDSTDIDLGRYGGMQLKRLLLNQSNLPKTQLHAEQCVGRLTQIHSNILQVGADGLTDAKCLYNVLLKVYDMLDNTELFPSSELRRPLINELNRIAALNDEFLEAHKPSEETTTGGDSVPQSKLTEEITSVGASVPQAKLSEKITNTPAGGASDSPLVPQACGAQPSEKITNTPAGGSSDSRTRGAQFSWTVVYFLSLFGTVVAGVGAYYTNSQVIQDVGTTFSDWSNSVVSSGKEVFSSGSNRQNRGDFFAAPVFHVLLHCWLFC